MAKKNIIDIRITGNENTYSSDFNINGASYYQIIEAIASTLYDFIKNMGISRRECIKDIKNTMKIFKKNEREEF